MLSSKFPEFRCIARGSVKIDVISKRLFGNHTTPRPQDICEIACMG